MKNTNNAKKLTLNKETIRNLSDEKLGQVAGGEGDSGAIICLDSIIGVCDNQSIAGCSLAGCSFLAGNCGGK